VEFEPRAVLEPETELLLGSKEQHFHEALKLVSFESGAHDHTYDTCELEMFLLVISLLVKLSTVRRI